MKRLIVQSELMLRQNSTSAQDNKPLVLDGNRKQPRWRLTSNDAVPCGLSRQPTDPADWWFQRDRLPYHRYCCGKQPCPLCGENLQARPPRSLRPYSAQMLSFTRNSCKLGTVGVSSTTSYRGPRLASYTPTYCRGPVWTSGTVPSSFELEISTTATSSGTTVFLARCDKSLKKFRRKEGRRIQVQQYRRRQLVVVRDARIRTQVDGR
ncbi:hypothetical protein T265_00996 [Opisthorchis viverrini]|uniref:Uncharacterized protein n=1 Tax=Opisthorchis viverrini TaxID=6198 RepID=A0A075A068_OPIVI|nr:hypothetical protein T265_00996 [Opisthorchis viverrini]KER33103.1 hypothetical protein T265_00996 [Opisthorchis viverrini]